MMRSTLTGTLLVLTGIAASSTAAADAITDFYHGRTVTVLVASGPDGLAGLYGRVVGEHLGHNIPGAPTIVHQFMPGSGGTKGANYCFNVAPKDGSVVCQLSPTVPMVQLLRGTGVKYDAAKFNWLGQSADQNGSITISAKLPVKTLQDAKIHEVLMGATGKASETYIDPTLVNAVLGTRFKPIMGYRSGGEIDLAIERGEIQGKSGPIISNLRGANKRRLDDGSARILVQMGLRKHPSFPNVPLLTEFAPNEDARRLIDFVAGRAQVGRAFVAPPNVPANRIDALRKAFDATMKDPALLADATKLEMEINPSTGAEVEQVVARILSAPQPVIDRARRLLGTAN